MGYRLDGPCRSMVWPGRNAPSTLRPGARVVGYPRTCPEHLLEQQNEGSCRSPVQTTPAQVFDERIDVPSAHVDVPAHDGKIGEGGRRGWGGDTMGQGGPHGLAPRIRPRLPGLFPRQPGEGAR